MGAALRTSELTVGLLFMALSLGCEALVQFKKVPESTGGGGTGAAGGSSSTGGASSTGAAGGSGGTSSSGTTSSPPMQCTSTADCNESPCANAACSKGLCEYTNIPAGTLIANDSPGDCRKQVCDGNGSAVSVADDSEVPSLPGDVCFDYVCKDAAAIKTPANAGMLCGRQPANACQKSICTGTECQLTNEPDGKILTPGDSANCLDTVCKAGTVAQAPNEKNCPDGNPNNCVVPSCSATGMCGVKNAAFGAVCVKASDGVSGLCNANGHCCSLAGCD